MINNFITRKRLQELPGAQWNRIFIACIILFITLTIFFHYIYTCLLKCKKSNQCCIYEFYVISTTVHTFQQKKSSVLEKKDLPVMQLTRTEILLPFNRRTFNKATGNGVHVYANSVSNRPSFHTPSPSHPPTPIPPPHVLGPPIVFISQHCSTRYVYHPVQVTPGTHITSLPPPLPLNTPLSIQFPCLLLY